MVFFLLKKPNEKFKEFIFSLSAGVMLSSTIFSLIIPSLEAQDGLLGNSIISTSLGMVIGVSVMFLMDQFIKYKDNDLNLKKMFTVMTIHNIPEGVVVGIATSLILIDNLDVNAYSLFISLVIGIGIQNIPEGLVVSLPFYLGGYSKRKSFTYGFISGIVEPIFSIITIMLSFLLSKILPFLLSISAGMILYVVIVELVPKVFNKDDKNNFFGVFGFVFGFVLMLILDHII